MKDSTQNRKKKLLALFLSAMMAVSVASLAACDDDKKKTSSDSTTEEETTETTVTDKGPIKNAGFEIFDTDDGLNVIGINVSNWSRSLYTDGSVSAPSSKADSGIIDTGDTAWNNLTGSYYVTWDEDLKVYNVTGKDETFSDKEAAVAAADTIIEGLSESNAISMWDKFTTRDKLKYYEVWKDKNEDGKISSDFSEYESFNSGSLALIDVPDTVNPGTHHSDDEKADETKYPDGFNDHNVLMIHNKNPETDEGEKVVQSIGSAQKFTSSSSVTISAGAAAEISVWVKTQDLMCSSSNGTAQEAVDKGAYISLAQTVGGTTLPAYEIKNINTEYMGLETTNGWKQYTFYVKGSSYATTTVSLTLGLGQGTSSNRSELVNGYAFFDDIQCKIFPQEDFYKTADTPDGKVDINENNVIKPSVFEDPEALKTIDLSKEFNDNAYAEAENLGYVAGQGFDVFPIDFYGEFVDETTLLNGVTSYATKSKDGYTSEAGNNTLSNLAGGRDGSADLIKVFDDIPSIANYTSSNATQQRFVNSVYNKYLSGVKSPDFNGDNSKVLFMMSAYGVAYTVDTDQVFSFDSDNEYMAVSFFVRTSDMNGFTGAGVSLVDGKTKTSFSALDTTDITPVNIGIEGEEGYQEDIYDGWQQCIFFVKNDSDNPNASFQLQITFGPTTLDENSTIDSFEEGFAAFTHFQTLSMSEEEYNSVNEGTYMKLVTITGETEVSAAGNSGFDTAGNESETHKSIEDGIALAQNYKGVYSDSDYVTGKFGENTAINSYANAGLLNRNYFIGTKDNDSYYTTTEAPAWMDGVTKIAQYNDNTVDVNDAAAVWKAAFGNATQPLFIWNDGSENSYGFIGNSTTIAASSDNTSVTAISMRVKVGTTDENVAAPTAHIYLIDTSTSSCANTLSIGSNVTYWYDAKGDLYEADPTEGRKSEKAFILQDNGLYIANSKWSKYDAATMKGVYYANLNAYTETDANGNKLVAANGGIHSYVSADDYVKVHGEKRAIAFYKGEDGVYYADKACKVPVSDFSVTGVATRTDASTQKALHAEVTSTDAAKDGWVTVTFYIKTGATAKNYRLEVWSGDREGNANAAGTYVAFDGNPSASTNASTDYDKLLTQYEKDDTNEQYKGVFSYYDTDKFLRYEEALDDEKHNAYKNYDATAQTEATFYLYTGATNANQTFFVNYGTQDQVVNAVAKDSNSSTDNNDSSTTTTNNGAETNGWLLASSIVVAAVLVLAIVSIVFRKIWKKARKSVAAKKRVSKNKKSKSKNVKETTVKVEKEKEEIDEDSPYND